MSNWTPRYSASGVEYPNPYYWNPSINPNATFGNALANCTTYAYGRPIENGNPPPVTRIYDAKHWVDAVNTAEGWRKLDFSWEAAKPGDVLVWSSNHVAVVERKNANGSLTISESNYTGNHGKAYWGGTYDHRTTDVMGSTLQSVSNWMFTNYPNRTWNLRDVWSATWILSNPGTGYDPGPTPPGPPQPEPSGEARLPIWMMIPTKRKGGIG